jgi:hypothetical protein
MWKCAVCAAFAMCVLVHSHETKCADETSQPGGGRLLRNSAGNESSASEPNGAGSNHSDDEIQKQESEFFVLELFKKYNNSTNLTLDGFARLVCRLGLVPAELTENPNVADDTSRSKACDKVTFAELERVFAMYAAKQRAEYSHDQQQDHGDHIHDSHEGHDHQPNRNVKNAEIDDSHTHYNGGDKHDHEHAGDDHSTTQIHSTSNSTSSQTTSSSSQNGGEGRRRRRRAVGATENGATTTATPSSILLHSQHNHSKVSRFMTIYLNVIFLLLFSFFLSLFVVVSLR